MTGRVPALNETKDTSTMRSNSKLALAALLGALMLSAMASASASAGTCVKKEGSKKYLLCVAGHSVEETANIEAPAHLTSSFSLGLPKQWKGTIVCSSVSDTSVLTVHGLTASLGRSGRLELSGCNLQGNLSEKCRVVAIFLTQPIIGTFGSVETIAMAPESGTTFFEVRFENVTAESCPLIFRGTHAVTGEYECKLGEAKVEAVEHALTYASSATHKVKVAGEEVALSYAQAISLGGTRKGQKFSVYEG
jgi:hypothetical protein